MGKKCDLVSSGFLWPKAYPREGPRGNFSAINTSSWGDECPRPGGCTRTSNQWVLTDSDHLTASGHAIWGQIHCWKELRYYKSGVLFAKRWQQCVKDILGVQWPFHHTGNIFPGSNHLSLTSQEAVDMWHCSTCLLPHSIFLEARWHSTSDLEGCSGRGWQAEQKTSFSTVAWIMVGRCEREAQGHGMKTPEENWWNGLWYPFPIPSSNLVVGLLL